jgi:hypothetical protein
MYILQIFLIEAQENKIFMRNASVHVRTLYKHRAVGQVWVVSIIEAEKMVKGITVNGWNSQYYVYVNCGLIGKLYV